MYKMNLQNKLYECGSNSKWILKTIHLEMDGEHSLMAISTNTLICIGDRITIRITLVKLHSVDFVHILFYQ